MANADASTEAARRDAVEPGQSDPPGVSASLLSAERLHSLLESIHDYAIYMLDVDGHVVTWNAGAERLKGYSADEIVGRHYATFFAREDIEAGRPARALAAAALGQFEDEFWRVRKDGSRFWARVVLTPVRDADDRIVGFAKVTHDVTQSRHPREPLARALEAAPTGMLMTDGHGRIVLANAAIEALFGHPRERLIGEPTSVLRIDATLPGTATPQDAIGLHADGTEIPIELARTPLVTPVGDFVLCSVVDVTHRRAAERERERLLDQLTRLNGELEARVRDRTAELASANEALAQGQRRLADAQRIAGVGSWTLEVPTNRVTWSSEMYRIFGRPPSEQPVYFEDFASHVHPDDLAHVTGAVRTALRDRTPYERVFRIIRGDGELRVVHSRGVVTNGDDGELSRLAGTVQDVTERERIQARLRESDAWFQQSLEMLATASRTSPCFTRVSPGWRILGYTEAELLATPFIDLIHPDDVASTRTALERLAHGDELLRFENRYRCKDGSYRWIAWTATPGDDGLLYGSGRDVTERKAADAERDRLTTELEVANRELQARLRERDVLMQEIHHRVKNNLQVVSSMINMQVRRMEPGAPRAALEDCRGRVQAIAQVHEQLYRSNDYAHVPFADYVRSVASDALRMAARSGPTVQLELAIEDIALALDTAIPCGLVLNELVANAAKHGFPDGRRGTVRVGVSRCGDRVCLSVADDGVGPPPDWDLRRSQTLGLQLVRMLAEQLDASLEIHADDGLTVAMTFEERR